VLTATYLMRVNWETTLKLHWAK